jgi:hypothetical protein
MKRLTQLTTDSLDSNPKNLYVVRRNLNLKFGFDSKRSDHKSIAGGIIGAQVMLNATKDNLLKSLAPINIK